MWDGLSYFLYFDGCLIWEISSKRSSGISPDMAITENDPLCP